MGRSMENGEMGKAEISQKMKRKVEERKAKHSTCVYINGQGEGGNLP